MSQLTLISPAKINLYLRILSKRKDGYHNIETVMQKIGLCDTLILKEAKDRIKIFCIDKTVPVNKNNLCYQAADLLIKKFSVKKGIEIFIKKKIPVAAGLGGGSSNAASVLLGLNKLWNLRIAEKELLKIGAKIGADVPFFISSFSTAKCKGKGDELSNFPFSEKVCYLLVVPDFAVSTKEIYNGLCNGFLATQSKPLSPLEFNNDLEKIVIKKFPLIAKIKQEFEKLGIKSAMSGSGSAVFGIFKQGIRKNKTKDYPHPSLASSAPPTICRGEGNEVQRRNEVIAKQAKGVVEAEKKFRKFGRTYICSPC